MRAVLLALAVLNGCAMSPDYFQQQRKSLRDAEVCAQFRHGVRDKIQRLMEVAWFEAQRRGLTMERCEALLKEEDAAAAALAGIAVTGVLVAAAVAGSKGGGGSGVWEPIDTDWDWDLFYNEQRQLVWACRGVQTGKFKEMSWCQHKTKIDRRWPSLEAPR